MGKKIKIEYNTTNNGCWECYSHALHKGYPRARRNGKQTLIHRIFYERKYNVTLSSDIILRHICDNPLCINPEHLIPGTHEDNVADRIERDRSAKGAVNGRSKLTEKEVLEIRNNTILNNRELSNKYKVDRKLIRLIRQNKIWKHI